MSRTVKKRPISPKTTQMGQGYADAEAQGGGIVPGAHPEYEQGMKLGNPVKQIGDLWNKMFPKKAGRH